MSAAPAPSGIASLGLLPLFAPVLAPLLAMSSPWWENYDLRDRYLCSDQATVVLERNESQASLIAGRFRSTLFREAAQGPALRYANDTMRVILRGDELTLEQLPQRLTCVRTEEV